MAVAEMDLDLYDVVGHDGPTSVHPTAVVDPKAELGRGVFVGPFCVVGPKVKLGDGVRLLSHVLVDGRTTIGARTAVHHFASIGVAPQDIKYRGEEAELVIGEENSIRQYVNVSLGTAGGGGRTSIGRRNLLMVHCHVGHDSVIEDNCIFANGVSLGGHVQVQSHAVLGGHAAMHQFCRVGTRAMVGGGSMVVQDVPPFVMVQGDRARAMGLNVVGLRRAGYSADAVRDLKTMYRLLYSDALTVEDAVAKILEETAATPERALFVDFVKASERGVCR
jgi:UDP-N-acetylglucosamine acyltransferase